MLPIINEIIQKINTLIANIERCKINSPETVPDEILEDMKDLSSRLQASVNSLQAFLDDKKQNDLTRSSDSQFGEYTISILTENITDDRFNLRRRYGVALNRSGILVAQSQPTFASDDNVIINEVKQLIEQMGLQKPQRSLYTDDEITAINEARSYLADDNLNIDPDVEQDLDTDLDIVTDLNNFVSGLKRGRRVLRRARRKLFKERQKLNRQLNRNTQGETKSEEFDYDVLVLTPPGYNFIQRNPNVTIERAVLVLSRSGNLVKKLRLKAENDEEAQQLAIEEVDPNETKKYKYIVKRL